MRTLSDGGGKLVPTPSTRRPRHQAKCLLLCVCELIIMVRSAGRALASPATARQPALRSQLSSLVPLRWPFHSRSQSAHGEPKDPLLELVLFFRFSIAAGGGGITKFPPVCSVFLFIVTLVVMFSFWAWPCFQHFFECIPIFFDLRFKVESSLNLNRVDYYPGGISPKQI